MYRLSRFMLILAVLLIAYCLVCAIILTAAAGGPWWAWVVLLALACAAARKKTRQALTTLGSAAWATTRELAQAGMLRARTGLLLGRVADDSAWPAARGIKALFDRRLPAEDACREYFQATRLRKRDQGQLVHLPQAVHSVCFAPTRAGKGVSLVVPFLLQSCEDSCVVVDPKGELAALTWATRRAMKHRVVILDPFKAVTKQPDTYNDIDFIVADDPLALDHCRALAEALVIRKEDEKDPHWADSAEAVIRALIAVTALYGRKDRGMRSLQDVRDILSSPQKFELAKKLMREHGDMLARWGGDLEQFRGDELASVLTTSNRFLRFLDTLAIADSTRTSSFDPADLRRRKLTVYLVLPPEHMRSQSPLLRVWISGMFRAAVRGGLGEARKVHFILDEAAALGHMQALDDAVDKYAGYGIRLQFYYQSMGQLKKCWPGDQGQTLLSNTSKVFFGTNDFQTAQFISQTLGAGTIIVDSGGSNQGWSRGHSTSRGSSSSESSNTGSSGGSSSSWQQSKRELLTADEVLNLDPRIAITLTPGVRPVATTLIRYYEEPGLFRPRGMFRRIAAAGRTFLAAAFLLAAGVLGAALLTQGLQIAAQEQNQPPAPEQAPALLPVQDGVIAPDAQNPAPRQGARITQVMPASAAQAAGLAPGDVLLAVDGAEVHTAADLQQAVRQAGAVATLRVLRRGQVVTVIACPQAGRLGVAFEMADLPIPPAEGQNHDAKPASQRPAPGNQGRYIIITPRGK
jgi:type IV secretion system protein VirD4